MHKFFTDRGTHLAAMVAYFALLSFVPLVFLALSLFGLAHRAQASDFFVRELNTRSRGRRCSSIITLVHRVQNNAAALGIIGGIGLLWSSLSLFSALESALNIVYGLPNRRFLHGKGIAAALMAAVLTTLFLSLVVGAFGVSVLKHHLRFADSAAVAYVALLRRLARRRLRLPAGRLHLAAEHGGQLAGGAARRDRGRGRARGDVPGAAVLRRHAGVNVTLRTLGGPAILLLWMYVMANVIVFGGELNWWWRERRRERAEEREPHEHGGSAPPSTHSPVPQPSAPRPPE